MVDNAEYEPHVCDAREEKCRECETGVGRDEKQGKDEEYNGHERGGRRSSD